MKEDMTSWVMISKAFWEYVISLSVYYEMDGELVLKDKNLLTETQNQRILYSL